MNKMHYCYRLDELFANGRMWNHRTLRTLFDSYAAEWSNTTIDEKLTILEKMLDSGYTLENWIEEYKEFYAKDLNKPHVTLCIPDALEMLYNRGNEKIKAEILKLSDDYTFEITNKDI